MKPLASGQAIKIANGDYQATLVSVGAGIAQLTYKGKDLVVPHDPDQLPDGYSGKVLIPWPNRIANGKYEYAGKTYEVPVNEPKTGASLHGLVSWVDWQVIDVSPTLVTFETFTAPQYCYPFALMTQATYEVSATEGLLVKIITKNVGKTTAPYGVSSHPYLTCNLEPNREYKLSIPANQVLTVDENLIPVKQVDVTVADLDYREPKLLGNTNIDHAFTDTTENPWQVEITSAKEEMTVCLKSNAPWLQVFSADNIDRTGVAVEPMTCPANAFNNGLGLIELKPEEETTFTFSIFQR